MSLKFCANLSFMFQETPSLINRYKLASNVGFNAVECSNPYDYEIDAIVKAKNDANVKQILINTPYDQMKKEYGYAALDKMSKNIFLNGINKGILYAKALKCPIIHIMSGIVEKPTVDNLNNLKENLKIIKPILEESSIIGVIEAINPNSLPNYFVNNFDTALDIVCELNSPYIRLQLDIFHLQKIHGDLTNNIKKMLPYTSHIQIAQVPGRNEPNIFGEINYKYILNLLEKLNYNGYIGLEYSPFQSTVQGLDWIQQYGYHL